MVVSCATVFDDDPLLSNDDNYITLNFSVPGVETRGEVADNEYESYLSHLDVVVYEYSNGAYTPFHYQRVDVSATPDGKVSIAKTKRDFKESVPYRFYVIANSALPSSAYYDNSGRIISREAFLKLEQTDEYIHLSGIEFGVQGSIYPQMFVMDGVAYMGEKEPSMAGNIVINNPLTDEDVTIKVTLRRAAAKVKISITPGENVRLTSELMALSNGYMVRNMPIRTRLAAAGEYPAYNEANPYWKSSTISQTPYLEMIPIEGGEGNIINYQLNLTLYCYSHKWDKEEAFEKGTSVVLMLPIIYDGVEYINNYYQISFSKAEGQAGSTYHLIRRNTYYDLRITLNAPGAEDFNEPETIENITYFTAPWEKVTLDVSGESTVKYLKVNKEKIYMYNIADDNSSLYFSSSSPVTVQLVSDSAYYYNKYNNKISLTTNEQKAIYASTEAGSTSGNISVHSDIPTNNTIRYFQLKVTNQEGLSEIVDVEQYPLIYITNNLPWYSYRDDYYYRTTGGHKWNGNVSTSTTSGDLPTTYQYDGDHIVSVYTIDNVDVDTKTVKYTYSSAAASSSNGGTGWTVSKVRGNKQTNSEKYAINYYYFTYKSRKWTKSTSSCETHNVRNYHVRMMASSGEYTLGRPALDEYGYTAGDAENAKLVSPSFVIASRLGAVLSTYSGLSSMSNDKKLVAFADHCKNYVEVDDVNDDAKAPVEVYDNWRLPTEAELKIIMQIQGTDGQNADAIDFLLNGGYYMSASGPVFNPKNTDSTTELSNPMNASGVAIRCVRDAF